MVVDKEMAAVVVPEEAAVVVREEVKEDSSSLIWKLYTARVITHDRIQFFITFQV
jgi:hypothetical protein